MLPSVLGKTGPLHQLLLVPQTKLVVLMVLTGTHEIYKSRQQRSRETMDLVPRKGLVLLS